MKFQFDTSAFRRSHGKEPSQVRTPGEWAFSWDGSWAFTPSPMSWAEARDWAREQASAAGFDRAEVGS